GGLQRALNRVALTEDTRTHISYGETAALVSLAGDDWSETKGFAELRTMGADQIGPYAMQAAEDIGIALAKADYAISAGSGAKSIGVISGGQQRDKVIGGLTRRGWTQQAADVLAAPESVAETAAVRQYVQMLGRVKIDDGDIMYGPSGTDLLAMGDPSGKALLDDARIAALADCLGDVVAAEIEAVSGPNGRSAIAIGVRRPKNNSATPNSIICTAWSGSSESSRYASLASAALNSGKATTGQAYSEVLRGAVVEPKGGRDNIVSLHGDTPDGPLVAFQLYARGDVPGLTS
ncbi:MAG: hypothetical protein JXA67_18655, partial [Micromonosporaceae bacterium]|nr:hypothetical protein [Micromonosporaceae bacterium]